MDVPVWLVDTALIRDALGEDERLYTDEDLTSDMWVVPAWNTMVQMCPTAAAVTDVTVQRQFSVVLANMVASSLIRSSMDGYMSSSRLGDSSVSFREGAWEDRADKLGDRAVDLLMLACPSGVVKAKLSPIMVIAPGRRGRW